MRESGFVSIEGVLWHAHSAGGAVLATGDQVEVTALDGLELTVEPISAGTAARQTHIHN